MGNQKAFTRTEVACAVIRIFNVQNPTSNLQSSISSDGKRVVIHADDKLTAFLELERSLGRMEVRRENLRQN
jgi:hypothetical protein